jgi:hypothetical protein
MTTRETNQIANEQYISELLVSPIYATSKRHTFPQRQLLLETNLAFDCVGLFMLLYDFVSSQKLWYSYQITFSITMVLIPLCLHLLPSLGLLFKFNIQSPESIDQRSTIST